MYICRIKQLIANLSTYSLLSLLLILLSLFSPNPPTHTPVHNTVWLENLVAVIIIFGRKKWPFKKFAD